MARRNPPESMQHHLRQRLNEYARDRWPQLDSVQIRYRAGFAHLDGVLPGGQVQPLCHRRPAYLGLRDLPRQPRPLPGRSPALRGYQSAAPEEALDCACDLYLNDPTARLPPPTN